MSWFSQGKKGMEEYQKRKLSMETNRKTEGKRFYLQQGEEALIVFLDNEPFFADIHRFKYNNTWNNYITCTKGIGDCPLCNAGLKPTFTAHYSIIDTRSFTYNEKQYKNIKRIFPARNLVIELLNDLSDTYGNLRGCVFRIKRYQSKETSTGSTLNFINQMTEQELLNTFKDKELITPYDFKTILAPPKQEVYLKYGFSAPSSLGDLSPSNLSTNSEALKDNPSIMDEQPLDYSSNNLDDIPF